MDDAEDAPGDAREDARDPAAGTDATDATDATAATTAMAAEVWLRRRTRHRRATVVRVRWLNQAIRDGEAHRPMRRRVAPEPVSSVEDLRDLRRTLLGELAGLDA